MLNRPSKHRRNSNTPFLLIFISLAFGLGLSVGYLIWGNTTPAAADASTRRINVSTDGDPAIGPENAPVTIIEFSDYECPYCQEWDQQVLQKLLDAYPNQIRFVYRDNPLSIHAQAQPAAEAADCAGEQGDYWKFHDALFSGQYSLGREAFIQYATDLKMDVAGFTVCIDSGRYKGEVEADALDAAKAGLSSTPSFVINGRILIGAMPFANFKAVIDEELAANE